MKHLIVSAILALCPLGVVAQSQEDTDKGYLTQLIEDNLSGGSRTVSITGFQGALSSAASLDTLTVSDADGVWLTLENVDLVWRRAALLLGRIDVQELTAERIILARPPVSETTAPAPEASAFSLPELPVGINIDTFDIAQITLGKAFLGEEIALSLTGNASLSDGEGNAVVTALRLGEKTGRFEINGRYSNQSRELALLLDVEEGAGGIAATLLDLPGRPSTKLLIQGTAPLDNYTATLALATDGQDRISGNFGLIGDENGRLITLDIGGDVTPLFAPEYQDFFGNNIALAVAARTSPQGGVNLENLSLQAKSLQLTGTAQIGAQGWPERLQLRGQIISDIGAPVLLPLTGPKTFMDSASFDLSFDTAVSPDWTTSLSIAGFERPGLAMRDVTLAGGGILVPGEGDAQGRITTDLRYSATGLSLDDAGAAQAFGDEISGVFQAARAEGSPIQITQFSLTGPGIEALAEATIDGRKSGLRTQSNILLTVTALSRFSTLAGRDLAGSATIAVASTVTPLEGLFDLIVTGTTQDLAIGIPQADAVLAGRGDISAAAVRDTKGTRLKALRVQTPATLLTAAADITSNGSDAVFDLSFTNIGMIEPKLSGPAVISGTVAQTPQGAIKIAVTGQAKDTGFAANADLKKTTTGRLVAFTTTADITDLTNYAALAQRDLSGAASLDITGTVTTDTLEFTADITGETRDVTVGIAQLDPLLRGQGTVTAQVARRGDDVYQVAGLDLRTDAITITGSLDGSMSGIATAQLAALMPDASVLGQSVSGPLAATIMAKRDADNQANVMLQIDGPGTDVALRADISPAYLITGILNADIDSLAAYKDLIGQPVSGGINAQIAGSIMADLSKFDATANVQTRNLGVGNPVVDILLAGNGRLAGAVDLSDGRLTVKDLDVSTANLTVSGNLGGQTGTGRGEFQARLRDVGVLTDQLSGPLTANGTASLDQSGNWGIDAQASGPGGIAVRANGQIGAGGQLRLNASGKAPLGLANLALEPRRVSGDAVFDLAINGQPSLRALTGRIDLQNARLTAPTLAQGLSDIVGGVTLTQGRADIGITASVLSGGTLAVNGPINLAAPQTADLTLALNKVVLKDPELYKTRITGNLTVKGPITGGAVIAGALSLGQTDVQVPSSGVGALGNLPDVVHLGASTAIQTTLDRAGALMAAMNGGTPDGTAPAKRAFPLNIVIDAPSRIFIRGRGLDAELGGSLRIGGTSSNVQPNGLFELVRGRIDILQQRFELTEGSASLQGDFAPFIRLVATTESRTGTVISIIVEGPATAPVVSFTSIPSLPQDEVLSQLIFGRDLQSISPLQAVQLAAAVGTLAGTGGGGVIDNFRQEIGLDDFDVTTDEAGNAAVRAGKYLSKNVYTDVTVSSDGSTEINLNLDITNAVTAKGSVDVNGETGIGIFFEKDY